MAKFIDTPVKRYSSGMTVRLAFAVAAHLEPEILIVDEVLAVGDAEFQAKCISKLDDTATSGRTVLFVSHNMSAVKRLCTSAILLDRGAISHHGETVTVCDTYLGQEGVELSYPSRTFGVSRSTDLGRLLEVRIRPQNETETSLTIDSGFLIQCIYQSHVELDRVHVSLNIYTVEGVHVLNTFPESVEAGLAAEVGRDPVLFECRFPPRLLNAGLYRLEVYVVRRQSEPIIHEKEALYFSIADKVGEMAWHGKWNGVVRPRIPWSYRRND
jgi:lipopolysaccharide transport system ATP-binding protein